MTTEQLCGSLRGLRPVWPFVAGLALGQHPAPMDYKGVTESVLAAIDLAKEIDSVENRELRVSRATVALGGHIGLHSHQGGPTIVYISAGVLTNHHDDGTTQEVRPGQVFAEFGPRSQTTQPLRSRLHRESLAAAPQPRS